MASTTKTGGRRRGSSPKRDKDEGPNFASDWRSWLLALLLIAGVVVAVLHWGDVKKFADLVAHSEPQWLAAAAVAQLLTYVALAGEWALVLSAGKCRSPFGKLLGLTVSKHFADQMVPTAGMSGNLVVVDRLQGIGASRAVALAALIMTIIAYYASYGLASLVALVLLRIDGHTSWVVLGLIGASLALSAAVPALAFWLHRKGAKAIPRWLRRIRTVCELFEMIKEAPTRLVRSSRLIGELTLLNCAVFALDGLTMQFCLFALGVHASFSAAFSAFIMASIVVTFGPIPMGLGSFEAVSIGMLRATGVPFEAALSATLLFRGYTLWVPLIPGMFAARRQLKRKTKARRQKASARG
ncbi:MAG TPA: lysylphosphatidylglycerol synthase transmembrane domain-containing protein [Sphingomicrobium sp.]|nr:lysylphosphatidylglycerol synthase transmembrane domain-containing protein [Sphingomicrobium sp.]